MSNWVEPLAYKGLIWSNFGLLAFAAILVVGLIGEYKKPAAWSIKTFELLVIIGVVGELIFDGLIFGCSLTLDAAHSAELARAQSIASAASERAATAIKAAADANERAGNAYEAAGAANKLAGEASERAANLEVQAANLKAKNLDLERQQADTQRQLSVRPISDDQRDKFVNSIEGHQRTVTLVLPNDQEARAFGAERVQPMIKKAGFVVKIEDLQGTSKHVGIIVCDNGNGEAKLHAAFRSAKIEERIFKSTMADYPDFCHPRFGGELTFRVFIGQRPVQLRAR